MGFFDSILFIVLSITFLLQSDLLLNLRIVSAIDILKPGDEFNDTSTLASSNGVFTMGFYTISPSGGSGGSTTLNLTYLGIWPTNERRDKPLWIANRDQPINGDAILTIDVSSGTLRVKNRNGATLFDVSDDKVGLVNNNNTRRAMLQDSGNLIVYDIVTNHTIWESFDQLTDTLIHGMRLGYNHTAKKNWELTSWANNEVPTSGAFTMRLEHYQNSPQLLIYRHGDLYWASGPWNSTTETFPFLYHTGCRFKLTYDHHPSGKYLIVHIIRSGVSSSTILHLVPTGIITYNDIMGMNFCFGYESDSGCVVSALPHCRAISSKNDATYGWEFYVDTEIGTNYKIDDNSSISLGDCMERCWNDCDCRVCSTYNDNGTGCTYTYGTEQNPNVGFANVTFGAPAYTLYNSDEFEFKHPINEHVPYKFDGYEGEQ